jgi:hypothetical protein
MKRLLTLAFCGLGLLALSSTAQAAPITGEIHFAGWWNPVGGIGTATGIDFSSTGFQIVLKGTGDYAGALTGTGATFQNFTFDPALSPDPVVHLWSFSSGGVDYSFDLTSVAVSSPQTATQLTLIGSGVLHATGFDDTPADWNFTGNPGGVNFGFSAANNAVPEPATVGLLGLGLVGLTAAGKKRTRRSD